MARLTGVRCAGYRPRGRFLDLRTLAFALTNQSYNLRSAGEAFGAKVLKSKIESHGIITPEYIDYARSDVHATESLLDELRAELDLHPIDIPPDQARSPASIAKVYLDAMGVTPPMQRTTMSLEQIGAAMSAYFGGRSECRIRCQPAPVVYVDFLSMYPTVNTLMSLWQIWTAEHIDAVDAIDDVRARLSTVSLDAVFDPLFWRSLTCFVLVDPDEDILPLRAPYGHSKAFNIGINRVTSSACSPLCSSPFTVMEKKAREIMRLVVAAGLLRVLYDVSEIHGDRCHSLAFSSIEVLEPNCALAISGASPVAHGRRTRAIDG